MKVVAVPKQVAAAAPSASCRCSQRIFGPPDWLSSPLPLRSSTVAGPIRSRSSATSAAARVSTP